MAAEVTIPYLGHTMTVAKIVRWLKAVGDSVAAGETILEIETDKVNYGLEAPADGVLRAILAEPGEERPVGAVVGLIAAAGEVVDLAVYAPAPPPPPGPAPAQDRPAEPTAAGLGPAVVLASPLAKKVAREKGVDLSLVRGSGRSGRIRLADVEAWLAQAPAGPGSGTGALPPVAGPLTPTGPGSGMGASPPVAGPLTPAGPGSGMGASPPALAQVIPLSSMRRAIARRLSQSFQEAPHFYLLAQVDLTEAKKLHGQLRERVQARHGVALSLTDLFLKAVAMTLGDYPLLNAQLNGERIEVFQDINLGLAVAVDEGLIVPALTRVDQKKLWRIAQERTELVERARQGRLSLEELERGTFTLSNLGQFDIVSFTSILNPPQTGILSIGRVADRPVARQGQVVIRPMVELSLTVDHRVVDGAVGARFLQDLKAGLEEPALLH